MSTGSTRIPRGPSDRVICFLLIIVIGAVGLYLRIEGNSFGLPFGDYADEAGIPFTAARIVGDGDWNPHYFNYPPLTVYTIAVATAAVRLVDTSLLRFAADLTDVELTHRVGRWLSAFWGLGCILLAFLIARRLFDQRTGIIAAALMAVQPTLVFHSHLATVDTGLIFWILFSSFFMAHFVIEGKHYRVFIAAIATGIATAVKYNGIALLGPVVFLFLLFSPRQDTLLRTFRWFLPRGAALIIIAAMAFLVLAPYTLLDFDHFSRGFLWEMKHQQVGHSAIDTPTEEVDTSRLWTVKEHAVTTWKRLGPPIVMAFFAGIFFIIRGRMVRQGSFFLIPVVLFLSMSWSRNAPERYTMLLFPFLIILSSYGASQLFATWRFRRVLVWLCLVIMVIPLVGETSRMLDVLREPLTTSRVRNWFFSSIPGECGIAADIYAGVWVSAARRDQVKLPSLSHRSPSWYREHGMTFLVLSSLIRERDRALFGRDAWRRTFYDWLPRECHWIARFEGTSFDLLNPTIDVFVIRPAGDTVQEPPPPSGTVVVDILLDRPPAQRLTMLWQGRVVYNDSQREASLRLPLLSGNPCDMMGILFFRADADDVEPIQVFLSLAAGTLVAEMGALDPGDHQGERAVQSLAIIPDHGTVRAGEPFVFRLQTINAERLGAE